LILDTAMNTVRVLLIDAGEAAPIRRSVNTGSAEHFRVTRKPTLFEGLEALQKPHFDLILLNLSLPDASAAESVTKVLKMAQGLPVIALVNEGETNKTAEALRHGAQDYVLKGCHCDSLIRTLQFAMERKRLTADRDRARLQVTKNEARLTAHLSHEIRNALACIHQFGNILVDGLAGQLCGEQSEYLGIMLENASKIRSVLDSALEGTPDPIEECTNKIATSF
jgi:DNA-binding response OmpR family regulator